MTQTQAILIYTIGVALGCVIDAVVKDVTLELSLITLLAWRFMFGGSFALTVYMSAGKPRPNWPAVRFHTLRSAIQLLSGYLFFWALSQRSLADITVIGFTAALMVAPLARIVLGEKITSTSIIAAIIGFAGAVFAVSGETTGAPVDGHRTLGAIAGFIAAFLYALTLVLVRLRARQEDSLTIVMFTNVLPAIMLLPVLVWSIPSMDWAYLPLLICLGALGFGVWWMFTLAYANAPAQRLAPIEYTSLIWAAALGIFFFDEVPGWQLYVGALIIIGACLIVAFETRFRTRSKTGMPASDLPD